jgi:uncharacterized protein (TIGR03382 family)
MPLIVVTTTTKAQAQSNEPIKPYVVLVMDVSGSMADPVTSGPPSCPGGAANKLDHAKCAVQNIANNYDEMVMALGRFRQSSTDTDCSNGCTISGASCSGCTTSNGSGCTATMSSADRFEVVVPMVEDNQLDLLKWDDYTCGQCTATGASPELIAAGSTPIAGALKGAKLYWQGADSPSNGAYWPDSGGVGDGHDPIRDDPLFGSSTQTCRPYITILLTDGDETCADFDPVTTDAAAAFLTTDVDGTDFRIEMKPIGFGKTPGDAEIEALAHKGGADDDNDTATHEGYYAQNEEELELAINSIIADAIKFESCNGADDDCDVLVDEDFDLGTCHDSGVGQCQGTGDYVCNTAHTGTDCVITDPGLPASTETCDGTDEDCDGAVDEGVCSGCTGVELCNAVDDDCDGIINEGLTRPCGTDLGICEDGFETCRVGGPGIWEGCTATTGTQEVCSPNGPGPGVDEDCDGTVDGIAEPCNSPGGNPGVGPCHGGTHVCPTDGTGPGECLGEVLPAASDPCNAVDDDCDSLLDEDFVPADCSSTCGIGQTECDIDGNVVCNAQPAIDDETCNGIDDDCDTFFDEDAPDGGACDGGGAICNGVLVCQGGQYVCVGQSIQPELCNCIDDDCDNPTEVDEGDICPTDTECVHPSEEGYACQCAGSCASGEFPCPLGRVCVDDFCLIDPCFGVDCPMTGGDLYECVGGECVRACDDVTCGPGFVCFGPEGVCRPDDCTTFPLYCEDDEQCVAGECISDPCATVTCETDEYCVGGDCFGSCADVECPAGERCRLGECEVDPCGAPCPGGMVCDDDAGVCEDDHCSVGSQCPTGESCDPNTGQCEQDPCLGVICPGIGEVCYEGSCFDPEDLEPIGPDAGPHELITAGGGGGCQAGGSGGGAALIALMLMAVGGRRRRRGGRS